MPALLDGKRLMPDVKPTPEVSSSADCLWGLILASPIVSVGCRLFRDARLPTVTLAQAFFSGSLAANRSGIAGQDAPFIAFPL